MSTLPAKGEYPQSGDTLDWADYHSRWEALWTKEGGLKVGDNWDRGVSARPLVETLAAGSVAGVAVKGSRALVPGCGRGYDVEALLRAGAAAAVGLEISPTAQAEASRFLDGQGLGDARANARVELRDFFDGPAPGDAPFDLGYDYTFFCAIHPDMRAEWARKWAGFLRQGGALVAVVFPVDASKEGGPPWAVTPDAYREALVPAGFEVVSLDKVPDDKSFPDRVGREYLLVARRI